MSPTKGPFRVQGLGSAGRKGGHGDPYCSSERVPNSIPNKEPMSIKLCRK